MKHYERNFSVILFPIIWVAMYLYRIVWFDLIENLLQAILGQNLLLLIALPFILLIEIPVGLYATFIASVSMCKEIFTGEMDIAGAIKGAFTRNK